MLRRRITGREREEDEVRAREFVVDDMTDASTTIGRVAANEPDNQLPAGSIRAGETLFDDLLARFIRPEIERRVASGAWNPADGVFMFQVVFRERGAPDVRLNADIGGTIKASAARGVEAGEAVGPADFTGVSEYVPLDKDRGVPHVTAFAHAGGWSLVFEFAGGHPKRQDFLNRAREFVDTARDALAADRLGAFVDNAFSATELLARAELLSCRPTVDLVLGEKDHGVVASIYKKWGDLGNTDKQFPHLLKQLTKLRPRGRYLDDRLDLTPDQARELLALLRDMEQHVARLVCGDDLPNSFNVYATRDIRAGELVGVADYALTPPRRSHRKGK